jgi:hypothetical protein
LAIAQDHIGPVAGDEDFGARKVVESPVKQVGETINFSRTVGTKDFEFEGISGVTGTEKEVEATGSA